MWMGERLQGVYSVKKLEIGRDGILQRGERTTVDSSLTCVQANGRVRKEASAAP